jgi:RNA polymerase sigma-70 factor, ECF subfamily
MGTHCIQWRRGPSAPPPAPATATSMSAEPDLDTLFDRLRRGDAEARALLVPRLYSELHGLARGLMGQQRGAHTLQPTALVNEAYLRLFRANGRSWTDRAHFLRLAATVMRQVLVDHARRKLALKRSEPGERVPLDAVIDRFEERSGSLLALEAVLERLADDDPELVEFVELRFFAGHSLPEIARVLGISERTAERRWQAVRLQLRAELERA